MVGWVTWWVGVWFRKIECSVFGVDLSVKGKFRGEMAGHSGLHGSVSRIGTQICDC